MAGTEFTIIGKRFAQKRAAVQRQRNAMAGDAGEVLAEDEAASGAQLYFEDDMWPPIWEFLCKLGPDLVESHVARLDGDYGGVGLDATNSLRLAARAHAALMDGRAQAFAQVGRDGDTVSCPACSAPRDDGRTPEVRVAGMNKILEIEGPCIICRGRREKTYTWDFDIDLFVRVIDFLEHCGGFEIW